MFSLRQQKHLKHQHLQLYYWSYQSLSIKKHAMCSPPTLGLHFLSIIHAVFLLGFKAGCKLFVRAEAEASFFPHTVT